MRVYELAKKIGMENKTLIPELNRMGISVASHSSTLEDDAVRKVLEKFMPGAKDDAKPAAKETPGKLLVKKAAPA
ncbi:MAG TPA: translation initiation factor IF-2 N-terminal domain-containing protein, partial [Nitrospirales bacterium]|nr:translation initiation factor IF-2 N-terminal domain-containing protein [Nitrospirales bacterium]